MGPFLLPSPTFFLSLYALQLEAFTQWRSHIFKLLADKSKVLRVLQRILNRALSAAFAAWLGEAREAKRLGGVLEAVVKRMQNRQLWGEWRWRSKEGSGVVVAGSGVSKGGLERAEGGRVVAGSGVEELLLLGR